jgi:hypothetical protein
MTKHVRRSSLLTLLLAFISVIAAGVLRAEPPPDVQQGGGIAVDFLALSGTGQHVTDLQPADVSIKVGGKQRTVSSLHYTKVDSGGSAPASPLPPPFAVNTASTGRNLLILIDNESLKVGTERAIRESLDQVLSQFGPADRVAFSVAPRDSVHLGFGAGVAAVRAALAQFAGVKPATVTDAENACRSRDSLVLLRSLMEAQAGSETPTSVIFVAAGLALPGSTTAKSNSASSASADQRCEVQTEQYQSIASAVALGRVNLYVAQGDDTIAARDNGLENLAGVSSAGAVLRAIPGGLTKILNESAGYYIATLAPDAGDRPGQVAKLEVKATREGVTVKSRADVAMSKSAGPRPGGKATPREMVATTAPFTDLQLRTSAIAQRGPGGKMQILALVEPVDPASKITALTAVLVAPGAPKAAFARSLEEKEIVGRPIPVGMAADPGKYRMRIAATDASGKSGAVDYDVDAQLTPAGPLQIGQLMLVAPRGEGYSPQLVFSGEPEIAAYVELYGPVATSKVAAKIEIAATADGKALVEGQVGGAATAEPDKFALNAKLKIDALPPGDYVVRAVVQVEGQPEGKVTRTMRKIAK